MMSDVTGRMTEGARNVLELALREALALGHNYIGVEHILLGIVRRDGGIASSALSALGATPDAVRHEVIRHLVPRKTAPERSLSELLREAADQLDQRRAT